MNYYHQILGILGVKYAFLDKGFWNQEELISSYEIRIQEKSFSEEEIHTVAFESEPSATCGPDGWGKSVSDAIKCIFEPDVHRTHSFP